MNKNQADTGYHAVGEVLEAINVEGFAILPPSPSAEILNILMGAAALSHEQAFAAYTLIQKCGRVDLDHIHNDPIAFRQLILLAKSRAA